MQIEIKDKYIGERIDKVILQILTEEGLSITRTLVQDNMGGCTVNGKECKRSYKLKNEDILEIDIEYWKRVVEKLDLSEEILPQKKKLDIRYEDENLIVLFKPKGMVVHPGVGNRENTLSNFIRYYLEQKGQYDNLLDRSGIVHRLDKGVSGLLVVAKNKKTQEYLKEEFQKHSVIKIYYANVQRNGNSKELGFKERESLDIKKYLEEIDIDKEPWKDWFKIEGYIGRSAKNRYKMEFKTYEFNGSKFARSWILYSKDELLVKIDTGRMHQIRATLEYLGLGIIGDSLYSKSDTKGNDNLALESVLLSFIKPDGSILTLKS
jgi:23S rRNA pseudouridine1911/1915/1917 synthase